MMDATLAGPATRATAGRSARTIPQGQESQEHQERRQEALPVVSVRTLAALAMVLTAATYWRAAFTFFAVDDFVYFANDSWTLWKSTFEFLAYPRGLSEAAFVLHRWLFGYQPLLFHIVPFGLHVANALLAWRLIRWALPGHELAAAIGCVLFTVHPAAYTPMAWLSPGLETVPCLTFSLCAAHLFVAHWERRGWWRGWLSLPAAVILMIVAVSFKNNILVLPAYLGPLALIFISRAPTRGDRARAALRVAISLLPVVLFALWFVSEVLWRLPHLAHPAYTRDLSPGSLARSYEQLLLQTFNVLPFFRQALGYQDAIPAAFGATGIGFTLYRVAFAALAVAVAVMAVRRGHAVFVIAMAAIVVGGLSFAAPLAHHLQDYYSYFVIPAACGLIALPLSWLTDPLWRRMTPRGRALAAGGIVLYAFVAGSMLHPANRLVRQAAAARAIDEFVRTSVGANQEMVFLPPNDAIVSDTVNGVSIRLLHPEKRVSVRFPSSSESQALSRSTDHTLLLTIGNFAGRGLRVYELDSVQSNDAGAGPYLRSGLRVVQRFQVHGNGLSEVHVKLDHYGGACQITSKVFEVHPIGSISTQHARTQIGSNTAPCSDDGFQILPVVGQRQSAGKIYELELSATGDSTPRLFHVAPVPSGFVPFVESSLDGESGAQSEPRVLAFRVVVDGDV